MSIQIPTRTISPVIESPKSVAKNMFTFRDSSYGFFASVPIQKNGIIVKELSPAKIEVPTHYKSVGSENFPRSIPIEKTSPKHDYLKEAKANSKSRSFNPLNSPSQDLKKSSRASFENPLLQELPLTQSVEILPKTTPKEKTGAEKKRPNSKSHNKNFFNLIGKTGINYPYTQNLKEQNRSNINSVRSDRPKDLYDSQEGLKQKYGTLLVESSTKKNASKTKNRISLDDSALKKKDEVIKRTEKLIQDNLKKYFELTKSQEEDNFKKALEASKKKEELRERFSEIRAQNRVRFDKGPTILQHRHAWGAGPILKPKNDFDEAPKKIRVKYAWEATNKIYEDLHDKEMYGLKRKSPDQRRDELGLGYLNKLDDEQRKYLIRSSYKRIEESIKDDEEKYRSIRREKSPEEKDYLQSLVKQQIEHRKHMIQQEKYQKLVSQEMKKAKVKHILEEAKLIALKDYEESQREGNKMKKKKKKKTFRVRSADGGQTTRRDNRNLFTEPTQDASDYLALQLEKERAQNAAIRLIVSVIAKKTLRASFEKLIVVWLKKAKKSNTIKKVYTRANEEESLEELNKMIDFGKHKSNHNELLFSDSGSPKISISHGLSSQDIQNAIKRPATAKNQDRKDPFFDLGAYYTKEDVERLKGSINSKTGKGSSQKDGDLEEGFSPKSDIQQVMDAIKRQSLMKTILDQKSKLQNKLEQYEAQLSNRKSDKKLNADKKLNQNSPSNNKKSNQKASSLDNNSKKNNNPTGKINSNNPTENQNIEDILFNLSSEEINRIQYFVGSHK